MALAQHLGVEESAECAHLTESLEIITTKAKSFKLSFTTSPSKGGFYSPYHLSPQCLGPPLCYGYRLPQQEHPQPVFFSQNPGPNEHLNEDFAIQDLPPPRVVDGPEALTYRKISLPLPIGQCIRMYCDNSTFFQRLGPSV